MAFNINAQVILSGPKNLRSITKNIKRQLSGLTATVNVKIPSGTGRSINSLNKHISTLNANLSTLRKRSASTASALSSLNNNLKNVTKNTRNLATAQKNVGSSLSGVNKQLAAGTAGLQSFGKEAANAIRRFAAFSVATGVIYGFVRSVQDATKNALEFQRELVKLQQITGQGGKALDGVRKTVDQLSKSLGIDANQLLKVGKTFAQTGQSLDQVRKSMEAVAKASLAPTFGTMESTTEGLIAALAQFNIQAKDSEKVLGALNAVSKKFAVESSDLIASIRKAGGVFAATANQMTAPIDSLNELISIFTAVRSTTRESADTIATGLRTIFTRIQRPRTIEFLKQFGIELVDLRGNFKGIFPAFKELSKGLQGIIAQGDTLTLARITEELGGIRQVGKLIPAIKNFDKALRALDVASKGAAEGLGKDVALALQPLAKQFEQLQARFSSFVRSIADSKTFQSLAKVALTTANAFLSMAEALKPLLPLITALAATKITSGLVQFGQGFAGGFKKGGGARGLGSAVGGIGGGGTGGAASSVATAQTNAMKALSTAINSNNQRLGQNTQGLARTATALGTLSTRIARLGAQLAGLPRVIASSGFGFGSRPRAKAAGGKIQKFASGGHVRGPSHGAGGVMAELEGGEYVVPKGYAKGGLASQREVAFITAEHHSSRKGSTSVRKDQISNASPTGLGVGGLNRAFGKDFVDKNLTKALGRNRFNFKTLIEGVGKDEERIFQQAFDTGVKNAIQSSGNTMSQVIGAPFTGLKRASPNFYKTFDKGFKGLLFENIIEGFKGQPLRSVDLQRPFDFTTGIGPFSKVYSQAGASQYVDARVTKAAAEDPTAFKRKVAGQLALDAFPLLQSMSPRPKGAELGIKFKEGKDHSGDDLKRMTGASTVTQAKQILQGQGINIDPGKANTRKFLLSRPLGRAAGGNVFKPMGTDTVPAMLTPGEFVINKSSAQKIGYSSLGKMNRMARGGMVPGEAGGGALGSVGALVGLGSVFATLDLSGENAAQSLTNLAITSAFLLPQLVGLGAAFKGLTKKGSFLQRTFTREGRATPSRIESTRLSRITRLESVGTLSDPAREARRQTALTKLRDAKPSKFAKIGKGGIATLIATLVADPVIDFIGSKAFGQQGGRTGRGLGRAEVEGGVLSASKGIVGGAATGAFVGSLTGPLAPILIPVGAAVGGAIGAIEGYFRGGELERIRQQEFNALQSLKSKTAEVTTEFARLVKVGHQITTTDLQSATGLLQGQNERSSAFQQATLVRRREEEKGFGGLGIGQSVSEALNLWATSFSINAGENAQQRTNRVAVEAIQSAAGSIDVEQLANISTVVNNSTEKLINGIGNLNPELLKEISSTADLSKALKNGNPKLRDFSLNLGKLQAAELSAKALQAVSKEVTLLSAHGGKQKRISAIVDDLEQVRTILDATGGDFTNLRGTLNTLDPVLRKLVTTYLDERDAAVERTRISKQLAIASANADQKIATLVSGMELLSLQVSQTMAQMSRAVNDTEKNVQALSQVVTEIPALTLPNVFKDLEITSVPQLKKSLGRLQGLAPNDAAGQKTFRDIGGVLQAQKELPDILSTVLESVRKSEAEAAFTSGGTPQQTGSRILEELKRELKDVRGIQLPTFVLDALSAKVAQAVAQTDRQQAGSRNLRELLSEGSKQEIENLLGPFSEKARKAMETLQEANNKYQKQLLRIGNLQLKLVRQQTSTQLKINQKRFDIQDKIDNILGRAPQFQARGRLQTQLQAILGNAGAAAGVGGVNVSAPNRLDQLFTQRALLEQRQQNLIKGAEGEGKVDNAAFLKNTEALERNKRATELLANDVTVLAELERRAALATRKEESAIGGIVGFSKAIDDLQQSRGPFGFSRQGVQQFNQFTEPIRALFKASNANALTTREARSLIQAIQSGDNRIAILLENLPGGREQADVMRRNIARGLAQTMRAQLMNIGGPAAAGLAQVPAMFENAIVQALGEKDSVAAQMRQVGIDQNRALANNMRNITTATINQLSGLTTRVDTSFTQLSNTVTQLQKLLSDANLVQAPGQWRGGKIQKFATGGYVNGPSHGAGGVMANLEGGEYVVPKKYAKGGPVYLQGGGSGFPSQSSGNRPRRSDHPYISNFVENLKYQVGFGSPEKIKEMEEIWGGTVSAHNSVIDTIGGGTSLLKSVTKIPSLIKNIPSMIKNLPGKIMGTRGSATATAATAGKATAAPTRAATAGKATAAPKIMDMSKLSTAQNKLHLPPDQQARVNQLIESATKTSPKRWRGEPLTPAPPVAARPVTAPPVAEPPVAARRIRWKGEPPVTAPPVANKLSNVKVSGGGGRSRGGRWREMAQMLGEGPGPMTPMDQLTFRAGIGTGALTGMALSGRKGPSKAAIQAREKLGGAAPVEAPTRAQQAYAGQLPTVRKLIDLGTKRKTIAAATERSQKIQDDVGPGTHKERMAEIEREREAILSTQWPYKKRAGLRERKRPKLGSMRAMGARGETPAEVAAELKRRKEAIDKKYSDLRAQDKAKAEAPGKAAAKESAEEKTISDIQRTAALLSAEEQKQRRITRTRERYRKEGRYKGKMKLRGELPIDPLVSGPMNQRQAAAAATAEARRSRLGMGERKTRQERAAARRKARQRRLGISTPTGWPQSRQQRAADRRKARQRRLGLLPPQDVRQPAAEAKADAAPAAGGMLGQIISGVGGFFGGLGQVGDLMKNLNTALTTPAQPRGGGGGFLDFVNRRREQDIPPWQVLRNQQGPGAPTDPDHIRNLRRMIPIRQRRRINQFAEGGSVPGAAPAAPAAVFAPRGTDTVPAMLTPGEFVINKSSAQSIGYNRLNSMNRMAQGGVVQPQYLQNGGYATNGGDVAAQLADSQASMNKLADALGKIPQSIDLNLQGDSRVIIDFGADMVPQVKKYFQEWYQEALKGPQGKRLDGSSPDPSMTNQ